MTENRPPMPPGFDPDEAPDLGAPEWQEKLAAAKVQRGRPKADSRKVSTTIRLDVDVIAEFHAGGEGWQSRINAALREWLERKRA